MRLVQGPEGAAELAQLPQGYLLDAASGMYYNPDTQLHYDKASQAFWSGSAQQWYKFDAASQQFVEIKTG